MHYGTQKVLKFWFPWPVVFIEFYSELYPILTLSLTHTYTLDRFLPRANMQIIVNCQSFRTWPNIEKM
jgi:hypothetical protein